MSARKPVLDWAIVKLMVTLAVATCAWAATEKVLHAFQGGTDGNNPFAGLIFDKAGNLYGTTYFGGASDNGTVFKLTPSNGGWKETVLYSFAGGTDGANPHAGLIFDKAGNLYGTTLAGGATNEGTVFELKHTRGHWTESVLHTFAGGSDGAGPDGPVILDRKGNLYGTTIVGGSKACIMGCGTVFELTPSRGGWKETVLYRFTAGNDGAGPQAGLTFDSAGNLFGTTTGGGNKQCSQSCGTVFELAYSRGRWKERILYSFSGFQDGGLPYAGLVFDKRGNIYGTTANGGTYGFGTAFELAHSGNGWKEKVLYSFGLWADEGTNPIGGVTLDGAGDVYGTTSQGTANGEGAAFELVRSRGKWSRKVLYDFIYADGDYPVASMIFDAAGNLYGTTVQGDSSNRCASGCGVVFEITP
jgi:uncharacterized repeat protein (TIGR03803 family)